MEPHDFKPHMILDLKEPRFQTEHNTNFNLSIRRHKIDYLEVYQFELFRNDLRVMDVTGIRARAAADPPAPPAQLRGWQRVAAPVKKTKGAHVSSVVSPARGPSLFLRSRRLRPGVPSLSPDVQFAVEWFGVGRFNPQTIEFKMKVGYPRDAPATVLFGEWFRFGKPSDRYPHNVALTTYFRLIVSSPKTRQKDSFILLKCSRQKFVTCAMHKNHMKTTQHTNYERNVNE
ncbi:hypothetical protein LXL04_033866 [Taraxacum kok-saghyz]